jgi:hypothetical protein
VKIEQVSYEKERKNSPPKFWHNRPNEEWGIGGEELFFVNNNSKIKAICTNFK